MRYKTSILFLLLFFIIFCLSMPSYSQQDAKKSSAPMFNNDFYYNLLNTPSACGGKLHCYLINCQTGKEPNYEKICHIHNFSIFNHLNIFCSKC